MAISAKLELRQGQSLVMTPQLQQAIKLLQLSSIELNAFVEHELERNPLLEKVESDPLSSPDEGQDRLADGADADPKPADDWMEQSADPRTDELSEGYDTDYDNVFPEAANVETPQDNNWSSLTPSSSGGNQDDPNLEAFVAERLSLRDHLTEQAHLAFKDPAKRLIASHLIDMVDEAGYLPPDLGQLSERLDAPEEMVLDTLSVLQTFEPTGICARSLGECLALQLKERNRYDPAIAALLENLHLLAAHKLPALKRICGIDSDDLMDMIAEIKTLDPKPGLQFTSITVQPVVPDVSVRQRSDGAWHVELNSETLPKILVNQSYYTTVSKTAKTTDDKTYLADCLQTANWLVKSLDQRARTILKVSEEIVRQQDAFLTYGIQHLRPLNLRTVADAINMHESTVSRVTSNKYMSTPRGIFELKYFFTSSISASGDGEAHSSESVRYRIRQLIDNESPNKILSDDKIVELLKNDGIDIARRTVAKYREAMRIPSSVQRRREKKIALQA